MSFRLALGLALAVAARGGELLPAQLDAALAASWTTKGFTPSPPADDATFLRRIYLDLVGVIPPVEDIHAFRGDHSPDRKDRIIRRLLDSQRFSDRWGEILRHLILGRKSQEQYELTRSVDRWLAERLARKVGLDRLVREILVAEGTSLENPPVAAFDQFEDSREDMAGHFAKTFLGVQIQCAQCHDHPFEKWTRADFYGLTAFFGRIRKLSVPASAYPALLQGRVQKPEQLLPDERNAATPRYRQVQEAIDRFYLASAAHPAATAEPGAGVTMNPKGPKNYNLYYEAQKGDVEIPPGVNDPPSAKKKPSPTIPRFLGGAAMPYPDPGMNRREELAVWMTAPENPYFARAMVNRVWNRLMGRGLVEPVDNIANPSDATFTELLGQLAKDFASNGFVLRDLVYRIVSTNAYQRSALPNATNAADGRLFSHGLVRALEPEPVLASLLEATGLERTFQTGQHKQFEDLKKNFVRQFVHHYMVDEPGETTQFQGTIAQALFTINGPAYNRSIKDVPGSAIGDLKLLAVTKARVRALILRVFAREPAPEELVRICRFIDEKAQDPTWGRPNRRGPDPRQESMWRAYEDVLWAMLGSAEFLNNH